MHKDTKGPWSSFTCVLKMSLELLHAIFLTRVHSLSFNPPKDTRRTLSAWIGIGIKDYWKLEAINSIGLEALIDKQEIWYSAHPSLG